MSVTILLPHVGESVVEGTIGAWLKQPGDTVERYEPLVEVITDKVTMEVPSPVAGSLIKVLAQEGETIPMGAPIAEMETEEALPEAPPPPEPAVTADPPQAAELASTTGYLVKDVAPVGPTGGGAGPAQTSMPDAETPAGAARLSPAVRRLVREHGVDPSRITGTGMGGRITREDVLKFLASPSATATTPSTHPGSQPAPTRDAASEQDEEYLPLTPVRRMIADAMVRSVSQIPHAWSTVEVDVSGLVALRADSRASFEEREGVELTYLPFIIKAAAESLAEHPTLNASWGGDKIILKKKINIGIAVAAPQGLVVPVIHDADKMSVAGLARAARDLIRRARQNKLTLNDVQRGTFTLNNTGALGSIMSQPIIYHPQAAIMTMEAIEKRAVVRDDAIAIRSMMNLCLSFDHRINDGAEAGNFLQAVKRRLESLGPGAPLY